MGKIIDVREVQRELDRAARDAKHGPAAVRAGRFVHASARGDRPPEADARRGPLPPASTRPPHRHKPAR